MTTISGGTSPADERVGTLLSDRYRIESVIGRGGMSVVYRAVDSFLGRTVAVKVFRPDLADAEDLRRQREEIQLLASLNHPTLVTLFDAIADESGRVSVVLEYVPGGDLRDELAAGRVDERTTAMIGADIADALAYVHERGIVHRDLKPANLLVPTRAAGDSGPHAKLADFGIARLVDGTRLTSTGFVLGTAGYLSPEQAIGGSIGPASDVYSLGLVLLECLTGVRAFEGSAVEAVAARLARDPEIPAGLGPQWVEILGRMTRREPDERLGPREASSALRALAVALPVPDELDATRPYAATAATAATMAYAAPQAPTSDVVTTGDSPTARYSADAAPTSVTLAYQPAPSRSDSPAAAAPKPPRRRPPRKLLVGGAIALLIVVSAVWAITSLASSGGSEQATVEYPVVDGDLGTHLEQLQKSVEK